MSDHQRFIDLALRLIGKHGRDVTFKTVSSVPADVAKPWKGTGTAPTTVGPFKAAFVPYRGFEFGSVFNDVQLFKECDEICMVAGSQADLETPHVITDRGSDFKIEWIQRLYPGDQKILYAFGVNR